MNLIDRYVNRQDFTDYDDYYRNLKINVPKNFNFSYDVVDEYARIAPDKRAIVWCNDCGEERIVSFGELKRLSDKAANVLTKFGIGKGDFVMVMLKRRLEYWILTVAMHKVGAIIIPATHLLMEKDIKYRVDSANVKMLVCTADDATCQAIQNVQKCSPQLEQIMCLTKYPGFVNFNAELDAASEVWTRTVWNESTDPMVLYFTSGTTGFPKMVVHSFMYPLAHIITAKYWLNVEDDGLHFTNADSGWAKSSWGKLYGQWLCGSAVFIYDYDGKFTPTDLLPLIAKYRVTTFCAPPTVYRFLIKEDLKQYDFSSLHYLATAGEPLNPEVFRKMYEHTGLKIHEGFGQTETCCMLATMNCMEIKLGSMGKPMPIYDVKLLDNDCNEVAPGEEGEICIRLKSEDHRQLGLFNGYYLNEEMTGTVMYDGFYHTGDLAYQDEDGYFWFVSRKDDVIKSSGYRIGPFEVESALLEHPAVLECAITGVPDDLRGQIVKATIVLANGYEPGDALVKELQNYVKHATAPYKYPRVIEFVKELPKTIGGKIRRVEIRRQSEVLADGK